MIAAMAEDNPPSEITHETSKDEVAKAYLDLENSVRSMMISIEENEALIKGCALKSERYANDLEHWKEMQKQIDEFMKTSRSQLAVRKELVKNLIKENMLLFELEGSVTRQMERLNSDGKRRAGDAREKEGNATEKLLFYWQSHYEALEWTKEYKSAFEMHEKVRKEVAEIEEAVADLRGSVTLLDGILRKGSKFETWKTACCRMVNVGLKNKKLVEEIDRLKGVVHNDDEDFLYESNSIRTQKMPMPFSSLQSADASDNMKDLHEEAQLRPLRSLTVARGHSELGKDKSPPDMLQLAMSGAVTKQIAEESISSVPAAQLSTSGPYTTGRDVEALNGSVTYSPSRKRKLALSEEKAKKSLVKATLPQTEIYKAYHQRQQSDVLKRTDNIFSMESTASLLSTDTENLYFRETAASFNRSNDVTRAAPSKTIMAPSSGSPTDAFIPPRARAPRKLNVPALTADRFNMQSTDDSQSPLNFVMNLMQSPVSDSSTPSRCHQGKVSAFNENFTEDDSVNKFAHRFSHQALRSLAE